MPIYPAETAGVIIRKLARSAGDLKFDGTATAGAAATITDPALPWASDDDEGIIGAWVGLIGGTAAGDERLAISPYTASSGLVTADRAWSATPTTTSVYIVTRRYRLTEYLRALQEAQWYQAQRGLDLYPIVGREIVLGSALENNFDLFTTANVPDGLTLDSNSTFTAEATVTLGGRRVLQMETDGTNLGSARFAMPRWGAFQRKTVDFYAHARSSIVASSRAGIQFNDGVTTATEDFLDTISVWQRLYVSQAMGEAATHE